MLVFALVPFMQSLQAQSERYVAAMEKLVATIETAQGADDWRELANSFKRIADVEKTEWLPYYYAAYSHVMTGYMLAGSGGTGFADKTDPEADQAEALLNKAEEIGKESSEIYCIRKMIASLRLTADPMNRYQTQLGIISSSLAKAKALDPANPRISLLEGQDKFYTPEEYGGSKAEAKVLFEDAVKKFEAFKPASIIHPQWGKAQAAYFLSQLK